MLLHFIALSSAEFKSVFWVLMPCVVSVGYQHFGGPCCLQLQGEVNGDPLLLSFMCHIGCQTTLSHFLLAARLCPLYSMPISVPLF